MTTGYSGTPLARKLGIKEGSEVFAVAPPSNYRELLAPLPLGVHLAAELTGATDIVHIFATRRDDLAASLTFCRNRIKPDGAVWVSWPKKTSGMATEVTEGTIREIALPIGLVDVKVCAVDEIWSGLKLVIRKALRS